MTAEKAHSSTDASPTRSGSPARELVIMRVFDAPRELVFRAWTSPEHLARWWGPRGFTNPRCEADARPGGAIHIDMVGPDGTVYPMKGTFHEVVEPERLVFTSLALEDESGRFGLEVLTTATFDDQDGKTKLTLRAVVVKATSEAAGAVEGMEAGWTQSLDRLASSLAETLAGESVGREFVVTRAFDAPRDLVFRAWTDPDHLARWFGPKGSTMLSCTLDLRPGGVFHYGMRSPDGREMWGRWVFREIDAPGRLVFVFSFSDEEGGVTVHPFAPEWPKEVLSTLTFAESGRGTMLTMRGIPVDATEAERRTFEAGHESMRKGWAGTLDQLAEHLARS